ncbi:putative integral membrane protein [Streptomyces himastatinicus ATCC 53653]|uniref:Putative integral membrane protein n=1 Tax=Streptomyces himastatinicus ATCC 53653 TaxID=457427 RepID=D9W9K5_9ACTN|nr:putative integral membrane protein [Streptomyces himastatinicus ATCC 53653]
MVLWLLYLSIVNVGQVWYGFGWESLLLEAGFLAVFLGNEGPRRPSWSLWLLRWLLFRLEFGAGLIKLRGDRCWRDLTCLYYHHETQPMPGPLSWYFHHLPKPLHRVETAANHVSQLVVPLALFTPQPAASVAAGIIVVTQLWLVASGNFSWLNWATILLALSAVDGRMAAEVLPLPTPPPLAAPPAWYEVLVAAAFVLVVVLSYWPARNMLSGRQLMNYSFNPLHLVNTYGAFGSVNRSRQEVVIEGTAARVLTPDTVWKEYEFRGKPGDVRRMPRQFAPYHLRLDWMMWFAGISAAYAGSWFTPLVGKLLVNDRATLKLLRTCPFPDEPPTHIRARLYLYRFTTRRERRAGGGWWHRTLIGEFLPPVRLEQMDPPGP